MLRCRQNMFGGLPKSLSLFVLPILLRSSSRLLKHPVSPTSFLIFRVILGDFPPVGKHTVQFFKDKQSDNRYFSLITEIRPLNTLICRHTSVPFSTPSLMMLSKSGCLILGPNLNQSLISLPVSTFFTKYLS